MNKWDNEKLEQMTQTQNEFTKIKLNYVLLAEKYFEIIEKTYENGDLIPLSFKDVEITYKGKINEDITLPEIREETEEQIKEKEQERQVMHIKHFSRSISHQEWFNYLDEEVNNFIENYPEYENIII
ncbi:MAG: hypothetical protein BZ135_01105 [Methanosphaera sp. rholeuAM6]|nr:MAG: hypothetical protein BZ135_01105 [Methanosphaera sp. rholeuAM6]